MDVRSMTAELTRSLEWRLIGPHRGGRVVAVTGHPADRATFYFGACAGGVWKTTSGGAYWENVSDGFFGTAAVGAIAVAPSDPNVIYAGTGEATIRSNVSHGDGVYRSTDGGRTWSNVGLTDTRHIGDIVVDPANPDIAYVAALGHAYGPNAERGVFRTRDGGASWDKVLYRSEDAGAVDLALDPANPRILYATIWEARRSPWSLTSGGPGSGLFRSMDGGDSWTELTRNPGLPTGVLGKIGVAASGARPGRVWAIVEADDGALFRSDDYGATWERLCDSPELRRRAWYYMHIYADPQDPETVWVLNVQCWRSIDGGRTFGQIPTPHGDNHDLWIDPRDPQRIIEGNDGGACVTYDGGRSWSTILNQPTAQFYHVTTDGQVPYHVYGSQQDNWAMRLPSIGFEGAISWKDYVEPGGGESGYIAISPKPPHTVYGGGIGTGLGHGRLIAWNPETGQKRNVTVWPEIHGFGAGAIEHRYRFQWTFPVMFSPHDPDALYICSNVVHRSRDGGTSWEVLSPDLTRNDPATLGASGGPITSDNSGAEIYGTIFAFVESPHEPGVFWAGSDDGLVHRSPDGGRTWIDVTPPDLPPWTLINVIEPSPHDPATVYLAATRYKLDDPTPYVYKTTDAGQSWQRIVTGLPAGTIPRVVRADPTRPGLLYLGTETGVWVSADDGARWQPLQTNLPVVPIYDLAVVGSDLVAATHGRSFWILDDLTPLRVLAAAPAAAPVQLFPPRPTTRYLFYGRGNAPNTPGFANYKTTGPVTVAFKPVETSAGTTKEAFLDAGANPPNGVIIHYALADLPDGPVTLSILDTAGTVLRTFSSGGDAVPRVPVAAGANRFVWDFREAGPTPLEDQPSRDPRTQMAEATLGPRVVPGTYQVRLAVGDTVLTEPFTVLKDPRLPASDADLRAQYRLKRAIRDRLSDLHTGLNRLRGVRRQVDEWTARARSDQRVETAAATARAALAGVEDDLVQLDADRPQPGSARLKEKLVALSAMIEESDDAPTRGALEVYEELAARLADVLGRLERVVAEDIATLTDTLTAAGVPLIRVP